MSSIYRYVYTETKEFLAHYPVVVILGPRQIGKTTIAKDIFLEMGKDAIYLDLELPSDYNALNDPEFFLKTVQDKLVIIDEVQRLPNLFPLIRALIDMDRRSSRFLLLGSADPSLLKGASESLAGRVHNIRMGGLNLLEIGSTNIDLQTHWMKGGFPEPLLRLKSNRILKIWFENFFTTYIFKDLDLFGVNATSSELLRFTQMLSYQNGSVFIASSFSKSLQKGVQTIQKWKDILEGAFLLNILQPWATNSSKRITKSPKVYIRDSGLLHYLLSIHSFQELMSHPIYGFSWESYVLEQIRQFVPSILNGLYFYRTQDQTEVDIMIVKNNQPYILIECKATLSPSRTKGFTTAIQDLKTIRNYIVIPSENEPRYIGSDMLQQVIGLKPLLKLIKGEFET